MSRYVPDVLSHRWVIISPQRTSRPTDSSNKKKKFVCPLCPGNEKMTPAEVLRYGGDEPNKQGWQVRVFPNKYPITDFHEVIAYTPDHKKDIEELSLKHVELIFKAYKERYNFYKNKGRVLIFCNHGEHSGASLTHPHSQLVVIPSQINLDTLSREPLNNIVDDNKYFNVYCPEFSQWPYEVWIAPKAAGKVFGEITDFEITDLALVFQTILRKIRKIYEKIKISNNPFGYNYYIYPNENWYIRLIPRLIHRAGFELGTGLSVNIVDPMTAASELREIEERMEKIMTKLKNKMSSHHV